MIKRIEKFERYGVNIYDVFYDSGRRLSYFEKNLTKTARKFINDHNGIYKTEFARGDIIIYNREVLK